MCVCVLVGNYPCSVRSPLPLRLLSNMSLCRPTVLHSFSRKSRRTVSVREGQAVVLLCGPPPHYGGTAHLSVCPSLLFSALLVLTLSWLETLYLLIIAGENIPRLGKTLQMKKRKFEFDWRKCFVCHIQIRFQSIQIRFAESLSVQG